MILPDTYINSLLSVMYVTYVQLEYFFLIFVYSGLRKI